MAEKEESPEQPLDNINAYQFEEQNSSGVVNNNITEEPSTFDSGYCNGDNINSPTDIKVECSNCACHMESVKVNVMTSETLVSAEYSSFNFWKTPLPQVDDLNLDSLTLEDTDKSSKTMHVHLSLSSNEEHEGGSNEVVTLSESNSEKQAAEDTHTHVNNPHQRQHEHEHSSDTSNDTTETNIPISSIDKNNNTEVCSTDNNDIEVVHNSVEVSDSSDDHLLVSSGDHNSNNERTSPILVSGVVTNELGEEIIEIREIDVKEDDAIGQQLTSLSTNTGTTGNTGNSSLHIINNKTQAGWGSLSSSEDQTDGGIISCLIPRVKITSHTDLAFGMPGVMNFGSHDDNINHDHDYSHKVMGSQVDMDITLDGVEESLAAKQVCSNFIVSAK